MKPFALDTVLTYRKRLEDIAIHRLTEAKNQLEAVQRKVNEENRHLENLACKIEQLQGEAIPVSDLIRYQDRILFIRETIAADTIKLDEKTEITKIAQHDLNETRKRRKIMENLKERQNRSWKIYLNKKEVALLDEVSIIRYESKKMKQNQS